MAERFGDMGGGRAVIAARSGDDARRRHLRREYAVERPARFERAGMLKRFKLQRKAGRAAERSGFKVDDRRAANVFVDTLISGLDIRGGRHQGLDSKFKISNLKI